MVKMSAMAGERLGYKVQWSFTATAANTLRSLDRVLILTSTQTYVLGGILILFNYYIKLKKRSHASHRSATVDSRPSHNKTKQLTILQRYYHYILFHMYSLGELSHRVDVILFGFSICHVQKMPQVNLLLTFKAINIHRGPKHYYAYLNLLIKYMFSLDIYIERIETF